MKELTSRQQQAIATKNRIKKAAFALLMEESYERLTMNKIAASAGVSVGSLYHYYASKEELFFSSYSIFDEMLEQMREDVHFDSPLEAIRAVIYAQTVSSFFQSPTFIASILSIQLSTHCPLYINEDRYFHQYVVEHVEKSIACGELIALDDARTIVDTILRTARGSIFDCAVRNDSSAIADHAMHDLDIVLNHYRPDHSPALPPVNPIWLDINKEYFHALISE